MQNKQLIVIVSAVALFSAGLGVVVTHQLSKEKEEGVEVAPDPTTAGGGAALDLDAMADRMVAARLAANENAAIATLRSLGSAQRQMQACGAIDTDADGVGEYAYLGEMAGLAALRTFVPDGEAAVGRDRLNPPVLASAFGAIEAGPLGGVVDRAGYLFAVYLPGAPAADGTSQGIAESAEEHGGARAAALPHADACETSWCAYAWPLEPGVTGGRAFFIRHEGDILETPNADGYYAGKDRGPTFDAALVAADMRAATAADGGAAGDGREWRGLR